MACVWSTPPIASLSPLLPLNPNRPPLLYEITVARDLGGLSCSASRRPSHERTPLNYHLRQYNDFFAALVRSSEVTEPENKLQFHM